MGVTYGSLHVAGKRISPGHSRFYYVSAEQYDNPYSENCDDIWKVCTDGMLEKVLSLHIVGSASLRCIDGTALWRRENIPFRTNVSAANENEVILCNSQINVSEITRVSLFTGVLFW